MAKPSFDIYLLTEPNLVSWWSKRCSEGDNDDVSDFFLYLFVFFWGRVSCNPGWPSTQCKAETDWPRTPDFPVFEVLRLQAYATMPGIWEWLGEEI